MGDEFKIFVHRLKEGQKEAINESFDPAFMQIEEDELAFSVPVEVQGEAECSLEALVLRLAVVTQATMPCAICNDEVQVDVKIPDFCHMMELREVKGDVFNFSGVLREAILLELPPTAECNAGQCPERASLAKYFSRRDQDGSTT